MTRKDYVLIATALRAGGFAASMLPALNTDYQKGSTDGYRNAIYAVADALKLDNVRFDRAQFLTACGVL